MSGCLCEIEFLYTPKTIIVFLTVMDKLMTTRTSAMANLKYFYGTFAVFSYQQVNDREKLYCGLSVCICVCGVWCVTFFPFLIT